MFISVKHALQQRTKKVKAVLILLMLVCEMDRGQTDPVDSDGGTQFLCGDSHLVIYFSM